MGARHQERASWSPINTQSGGVWRGGRLGFHPTHLPLVLRNPAWGSGPVPWGRWPCGRPLSGGWCLAAGHRAPPPHLGPCCSGMQASRPALNHQMPHRHCLEGPQSQTTVGPRQPPCAAPHHLSELLPEFSHPLPGPTLMLRRLFPETNSRKPQPDQASDTPRKPQPDGHKPPARRTTVTEERRAARGWLWRPSSDMHQGQPLSTASVTSHSDTASPVTPNSDTQGEAQPHGAHAWTQRTAPLSHACLPGVICRVASRTARQQASRWPRAEPRTSLPALCKVAHTPSLLPTGGRVQGGRTPSSNYMSCKEIPASSGLNERLRLEMPSQEATCLSWDALLCRPQGPGGKHQAGAMAG